MTLKELIETVFTPFRFLLSSTALRTYLRLILALIASILLFIIAVTGYLFFYARFVPLQTVNISVNLEHPVQDSAISHDFSGQNVHGLTGTLTTYPYGTAQIPGNALAEGPYYDVLVELELPRSPANLNAGNFMIEIALLAENGRWHSNGLLGEGEHATAIANSTHPAILTYWSAPVDAVRKLLRLPAYALSWKRESERVSVRMFEELRFGSGIISRYVQEIPLPESLSLTLKSRADLDVYRSTVIFSARLRGLRYFMRYYRVTSFLIFTTLFFVVEAIFALTFWTFLSAIYSSSQPKSVDQSHTALIKQDKSSTKLTNNYIKREDQSDDGYEYDHDDEDEDQQHTIIHTGERDPIKKEEEDNRDRDNLQGSSQAFPAFPQRRRKYSSTSSTSTPRSWPRSRSLSASNAPVRVKKEKSEEDEAYDRNGEGENYSTYDTDARRSTASSSGRDNDSGVWSWRLERGLDTQRRHEAARRRKS